MKKTVIRFGVISGAISALMMITTIPFAEKMGFETAEILGYTTIVLSFLLVFFGIRSYRDKAGNGTITFGQGLKVGLLITLISCVFYVGTWQILSFNFYPDFMERYSDHVIQQMQASGASAETVQAKLQEMNWIKERYRNPLFRIAVTLLEPLPIGLAATLLSAALLRRRRSGSAPIGAAVMAPRE